MTNLKLVHKVLKLQDQPVCLDDAETSQQRQDYSPSEPVPGNKRHTAVPFRNIPVSHSAKVKPHQY